MHQPALTWHRAALDGIGGAHDKHVIEFGSYNVNGTVRPHYTGAASYIGVDLRPGPDVDVVADVVTYTPEHLADIVVSIGSIEHCADPGAFIAAAAHCLRPGGWLLLHGEGGRPHGVNGGTLAPGESYHHITDGLLRSLLTGWDNVTITAQGHDVYAVAQRPEPTTAEPTPEPDAITETPRTRSRRGKAKDGSI